MLLVSRNPHHSSFKIGQPNLNPMGKIMPKISVGDRPVYSREEAKKVIQKGLERAKK
jgi:hypothetical protein